MNAMDTLALLANFVWFPLFMVRILANGENLSSTFLLLAKIFLL